MIKSLGKHSLK